MSSAKDRRKINAEAEQERMRREKERREFKEAQEKDSLLRTFKRIDKKGDGKVDADELMKELDFLGHKVKQQEAEHMIWEVDDDADKGVDWEVASERPPHTLTRQRARGLRGAECKCASLPPQEFQKMFYRTRDDPSGCEPRMLFNMVEFLMHDKNNSGTIDLDERVTLLYQRYGRVRSAASP